MRTSNAPSLEIVALLSEAFVEVSLVAVRGVWEHWVGAQRFDRRMRRMVRAGWVSTRTAAPGLERVVSLTEAGRLAAIGGRDPATWWRRPWDGKWRLALFDIPEQRLALRTRLRRKLVELGFGFLQNSVWISPDACDALKALLQGVSAEADSLSFIEGRPCAGESDADLVQGAWDFRKINHDYIVYLEVLKQLPGRLSTRRTRRAWLEVEWKAWSRAVRGDPLLPEVLWPPGYRGPDAWRRRREVLARLVRSGGAD